MPLIRCACGRSLGVVDERGVVVITHRGRRVIAPVVLSIQCEECGRLWRPAASARPLIEAAMERPAVEAGKPS